MGLSAAGWEGRLITGGKNRGSEVCWPGAWRPSGWWGVTVDEVGMLVAHLDLAREQEKCLRERQGWCARTCSRIRHGAEEESKVASQFREARRDLSLPWLTWWDRKGDSRQECCSHFAVGKSELKGVKKVWDYSWHSDCWLGVRPGAAGITKGNAAKSVLKMGFLGRLEGPVPRAMAGSIVPMRPVPEHSALSTSSALGLFLRRKGKRERKIF